MKSLQYPFNDVFEENTLSNYKKAYLIRHNNKITNLKKLDFLSLVSIMKELEGSTSEIYYLMFKLKDDWLNIHQVLMNQGFQGKYSTSQAASDRYREIISYDLSDLSIEDKTLIFLIKGYPYSIVVVEMLLRR